MNNSSYLPLCSTLLKKGVQNNATNTQLKAPICAYGMYPQSHSCAQHHRTLLKGLWGFPDEVPAWSGAPMGSGSAGGMQGVCRGKQGRPAFTQGAEHLYYYKVFSAVNLVQFQLQKGSCLKKYLFLHNFHSVFKNLSLKFFILFLPPWNFQDPDLILLLSQK